MVVFIALLFGAFIGSFLNVCVHRMPRNESIVLPPSRCYSCGTHIQWYDNLPLLSYLILRGRCRWCGTGFSPRYLLSEVVVAGLTAAVVAGAFAGWPVAAPWLAVVGGGPLLAQAINAAVLLVLVYYLFVCALIDFDHLIIPDELTKSMQLAAPFLAALSGMNLGFGWHAGSWLWQADVFGAPQLLPLRLLAWMLGLGLGAIVLLLASLPVARHIYSRYCPEGQRWSDDDHRGFRTGVRWFAATTAMALAVITALVLIAPGAARAGSLPTWALAAAELSQALLGSLAGWMSLYLIGLLGTVAFRRNAMGFGDVKFLAPIGAFLGPVGVLYAFFLAAVVGSLVGLPLRLLGRPREIPFGPYLAIGALIALWWGPLLHQKLFS